MPRPHLLITGATGFLGAAVLAHALTRPDRPRLSLLVRAESRAAGLARIQAQLRRFAVPENLIATLRGASIVPGDMRDLTASPWSDRLHDVSHVIHCAALASFGSDPAITEINVDGTLALARQVCRSPRLARFVHVGTAMAVGMHAPTPVPDGYEPPGDAAHLVPYAASKALAETRLRAELPGLPLVIARPSIIVGHTQLGCAPSASLFWLFRVAKRLGGFTCSHRDRIDIVPVDYCAEALYLLAFKPTLSFDRYHVSAGPERSCSFGAIDDAISAALRVPPAGPFEALSVDAIKARHREFGALFGPCNKLLLVRALELYGRFAAAGFVFGNDRLLHEGAPPPPPFSDYAGLCATTAEGEAIGAQMMLDLKWDRSRAAHASPQRVQPVLEAGAQLLPGVSA